MRAMRRKIVSLLLAAAMAISLTVTAQGAETMEGDIVILHTNDVHGAIGGYAKVAALKDAYEARGAYVLLLDAGDFIQGDPTVSVSQGAAAVELMNLAGYDGATLGNHEFDYGYENLSTLAEAAEFPIMALNVLKSVQVSFGGSVSSMELPIFEDHTIFTAPDGTKIGVFGLDTPETATKAHPAKLQGVSFLSGQELIDSVRAEVQLLEDAHCEYIVCLGHLGIDDASAGSRSIDLLQNVAGIDVFIDGHSHSTLEEVNAAVESAGITETVLTSTGTKLESVGVVTIHDGAISAETIPLSSLTEEDAAVAARAAEIQQQIDRDYGAVFAVSEVTLNGERAPGNRTEETNLGDLICDAMVWGAEKNGQSVDGAINNGGGIRASIAAGDVTKRDINAVLPFGNTLTIVEVTGAQLLEALGASTFCTPEELGGFPQVSGMEFTVDTAVAYDPGDLYPGSTYYEPASIGRVNIQTVGGEAFDPEDTYFIATNDFVAAGGDTYYTFAAAGTCYDLGLPLDEIVMDYISQELGGVVTAADYGAPAGRIIIEQSPVNPFTDVAETSAYYDGILWAVENQITTGTGDGTTFSPDSPCTRAQIAVFLWRAAGSPEPALTEQQFMDVDDPDAYYYKAIQWAAEMDMEYSGTFSPNAPCTRLEVVYFLWRAAGSPEVDMEPSFTDVAWKETEDGGQPRYLEAGNAVAWAVENGVTRGTTETTFSPDRTCTRGQIATFLYRSAGAAASVGETA